MPVVVINGTPHEVSDQDAQLIVESGNGQLETTGQEVLRAQAAQQSEDYNTVEDRLRAAGTGFASTLTGGATDFVFDSEADKIRNQEHGNWRLGGELAGYLPGLLTGGAEAGAGSKILTGVPGLAERLGAGAAARMGGGLLAKAGGAAVEAAITGTGQAIGRAHLSGDPLTVESVLLSAGRDALLAGGVSALMHGAGAISGKFVDRADEATAAASRADDAAVAVSKQREAIENAKLMFKAPSPQLREAIDAVAAVRKELGAVGKVERELTSSLGTAENIQRMTAAHGELTAALQAAVDPAVKKAARASLIEANRLGRMADRFDLSKPLNKAQDGILTRRFELLQEAADNLGVKASLPDLTAKVASQEAATALAKMPTDLAGIARMTPSSFQNLASQLDNLPTGRAALEKLGATGEEFGLKPTGFALRDAVQWHQAVQDSFKLSKTALPKGAKAAAAVAESKGIVQSVKDGVKDAVKFSVVGAGLNAVGIPAGGAGGFAAMAMAARSGLQANIAAKVTALASKTATKAARVVKKIAPIAAKAAPMGVVLGGQAWREHNKAEMEKRLRYTTMAADAAYMSVKDLIPHVGPEFPTAAADNLRNTENYMASVMPKDPGNARHMMRSDWLPSEAQIRDFQVRTEAISNPSATMDKFFDGHIDPVAAEAMWAAWPGYMSTMAVELASRVDELKHVPLSTAASLSVAFKIPLDGLMSKEFISSNQARYEVKPPQPSLASPGGPQAPAEKTQVQKLQGR